MSPPEFISARRVPVAQHPKEHPMLYAGPMVRAMLCDAPKTKTRREVTRLAGFGVVTEFDRTDTPGYDWHFRDSEMRWHDISHARLMQCCPFGQAGDRLWVRETWAEVQRHEPHTDEDLPWREDGRIVVYAADPHWNGSRQFLCADGAMRWARPLRWTPSIHMPRWASRIDLEITDVRVERLHDISEADAIAEGIERKLKADRTFAAHDDICRFAALWEDIHGAGSWALNPWVWVVSFRRIKP